MEEVLTVSIELLKQHGDIDETGYPKSWLIPAVHQVVCKAFPHWRHPQNPALIIKSKRKRVKNLLKKAWNRQDTTHSTIEKAPSTVALTCKDKKRKKSNQRRQE